MTLESIKLVDDFERESDGEYGSTSNNHIRSRGNRPFLSYNFN